MKFHFYFYFVTLLNGLVLIAALLIRKDNRLPNFFLGFLIGVVLYAQGVITFHMTGGLDIPSALYASRFPARFLPASLLYLYVLSLTVPGFKWSPRYWIHFLPFVLSLAVYLIFLGFAEEWEALRQGRAPQISRYIALIAVMAVTGAYLAACFARLRDFRELIRQYFSNLIRVRLEWLKVLLGLFAVPWLIGLADILTGPFLFHLDEVIVPVTTVLILILGFFGLRQSVIFSQEDVWAGAPGSPPAEPKETPAKKEAKPVFFSTEELQKWQEKLEKHMEEQRPYLEPEYRLVDLARALSLKPYQVSEILNRGVGAPFFEFINRYRIETAKKLLKDPAQANLKILSIAMDCGFNSKSSFNDTFRKFTGMTPSQFRDSPSSPSGSPD